MIFSASRLNKKALAAAFAENPAKMAEAFVRMGKLPDKDASGIFKFLASHEIASSVTVENLLSFVRAFKAAGKRGLLVLSILERKEFAFASSRNPERSFSAILKLEKHLGFGAKKLLLPSNRKLLNSLAKNLDKVADAFEQLETIGGIGRKYAFAILKRFFLHEFAAKPVKVAAIIDETTRILGRRTKQLHTLLFNEGDFRKAISADMGKLLKLAEISSYSKILDRLDRNYAKGKNLKAKEMLSLLDAPDKLLGKRCPYLSRFHKSYKDKWEVGREVARDAGLMLEDREVFINFAYAADKIGRDKTIAIYREFGIEYFARYTKKQLEELYKHIGDLDDPRPLFIVANNKADDNGAFYRRVPPGSITEQGYYNVIFVEVETEDEFYEKVKKFGEKYFGISVLQIGGHGTAWDIQLGVGIGEKNALDLGDMDKLKRLHGLFAEDALIILRSCSTGENKTAIGARISDTWGVTLFGPRVPTDIKRYVTVGWQVVGVTYREGTTSYQDGEEDEAWAESYEEEYEAKAKKRT